MRRVGGAFVVGLMTGVAGTRCTGIGCLVAGETVQCDMLTCQWKSRRIVIECGRFPGRCAVTGSAVGAKLRGDMIRIGGGVVIRFVASETAGRRAGVTVFMASNTRKALVGAGEREELMVVGCLLPAAESGMVAAIAITLEAGLRMIWIVNPQSLTPVARFALGSSADQLVALSLGMTGPTVGNSMNSGQREAALGMLVENIHPGLPVKRRVAFGTFITELTAMVVGVAIGTGGANMGEDRIGVAATTGSILVGSVEPEAGVIMSEGQRITQNVPRLSRVTIGAVPANITVGVFGGVNQNHNGRDGHQRQYDIDRNYSLHRSALPSL